MATKTLRSSAQIVRFEKKKPSNCAVSIVQENLFAIVQINFMSFFKFFFSELCTISENGGLNYTDTTVVFTRVREAVCSGLCILTS